MEKLLVLLLLVSVGSSIYFLAYWILKRKEKSVLSAVRSTGKKREEAESPLGGLIVLLGDFFAKFIRLNVYNERLITRLLKSADLKEFKGASASIYVGRNIAQTVIMAFLLLPFLFFVPVLTPVYLGVLYYIFRRTMAEAKIKSDGRRKKIEKDLPRFVANIVESLKQSRDIPVIIEGFLPSARDEFRRELEITYTDMNSGGAEIALKRLEARVASPLLSEVVRGLISTIRGDDTGVYFEILGYEMKQLEIQLLKKEALSRPPKIKRWTFFLFFVVVAIFLGIISYNAYISMKGFF